MIIVIICIMEIFTYSLREHGIALYNRGLFLSYESSSGGPIRRYGPMINLSFGR